jgi:methionine-S-sulfoxide reductase
MMAREEIAVFAGGCFWCIEPLFDRLEGVFSTTSGYMGGHTAHPTYEEVCAGDTGHLEVVRVIFDPDRISYSQLLELFWHHIDPLDPYGQFSDKGDQYLSAIFYASPQQKNLAEESKREVAIALNTEKIFTRILPMAVFYPAEDYHQGFHLKKTVRYTSYHSCSGRMERLLQLWGKK